MKITVVGGSRGTGAQLAVAAVRAGHDVTAVSRSGNVPDGVTAVAGSATDAEVARAAVTRSIIAAMRESGVRRLVVQSSLGAGDSGKQLPVPLRQLMKVLLAKPLADHNEQEKAVRESGLDWTIVRPTGLKDAPARGTWRANEVSDGETLGGTIPRVDLAAFMLEVVADDSAVAKAFGISS